MLVLWVEGTPVEKSRNIEGLYAKGRIYKAEYPEFRIWIVNHDDKTALEVLNDN